jgi:WD40 repeat protein
MSGGGDHATSGLYREGKAMKMRYTIVFVALLYLGLGGCAPVSTSGPAKGDAYARSNQPVLSLLGHASGVTTVYASRGYIYSGDEGGVIKIWSLFTGDLIRTLTGHRRPIRALCRFNDYLVSGGDDGIIRVWKLSTGKLLTTIGYPNGRIWSVQRWKGYFAISGEGPILLVEIGHWKTTITLERSSGVCTTNGPYIACVGNLGRLKLWDPENDELVSDVATGHVNAIGSIASDWSNVYTGSVDGSIRIWKPNGKLVGVIFEKRFLGKSICVTKNHLVIAKLDGISVRNKRTCKLIQIYNEPKGEVTSVSVSGNYIVSGASGAKAVRVWRAPWKDSSTPVTRPSETIVHVDSPLMVLRSYFASPKAVHVVGDYVFSDEHDRAKAWRLSTGELVRAHGGMHRSLAGQYLTLRSSEREDGLRPFKVVDMSTGNTVRVFDENGKIRWFNPYVLHGDYLVSCARNDSVMSTWRQSTGKLLYSTSHEKLALASDRWSVHGNYIITTGSYRDSVVNIWCLSTGKLVQTLTAPDRIANYLAHDDYIAVAGNGRKGFIWVWRISTGELLRTIPLSGGGERRLFGGGDVFIRDIPSALEVRRFSDDHCTTIREKAIIFDKDHYRVANDSLLIGWAFSDIYVWSLKSGKLVRTIGKDSYSVAVHGDFVAARRQNDILVWRLSTGIPVTTFVAHGLNDGTLFLSEKFVVLGGCSDGLIKIWRAPW